MKFVELSQRLTNWPLALKHRSCVPWHCIVEVQSELLHDEHCRPFSDWSLDKTEAKQENIKVLKRDMSHYSEQYTMCTIFKFFSQPRVLTNDISCVAVTCVATKKWCKCWWNTQVGCKVVDAVWWTDCFGRTSFGDLPYHTPRNIGYKIRVHAVSVITENT